MTQQVFELDNFRGPMDLLLHLIREQELEVIDVDLSALCDQYLATLGLMQAVDINVAGEYLVMASTLLLIKSRSILPREEEIDLEEELDPGDELIQQLIEYRTFKTLSFELERQAAERSRRVPRGTHEVPPDEENELEELSVWDLAGSFARLMEELGLERRFHTLSSEKPLRAYLRETLDRLASRQSWTLKELVLAGGRPHEELLGTFLALLELVKSGQVAVRQEAKTDEIAVSLREDRDPEALGRLLVDDMQSEAPQDEPGDEPEHQAMAEEPLAREPATSEPKAGEAAAEEPSAGGE